MLLPDVPTYQIVLGFLGSLTLMGVFYQYFTRPLLIDAIDDDDPFHGIVDLAPDGAYNQPGKIVDQSRLDWTGELVALLPLLTLITFWHALSAVALCYTDKIRMPAGVAMHFLTSMLTIYLAIILFIRMIAH